MSDRWIQLTERASIFDLSRESLKRLATNHGFPPEHLRQLLIDYPTLPMQSLWIQMELDPSGARLEIAL